jgi:hypothetical protein
VKIYVLKKHFEFFNNFKASIRVGGLAHSSEPLNTCDLTSWIILEVSEN